MCKTESDLLEEIKQLELLNQDLRETIAQQEETIQRDAELNTLLNEIIQHLPGMSYQCLNDDNWTMIYVTEDCYELTGYKPVDLIGNTTISYSELIHPDDHEYVWETVRQALHQKRKFHMRYRLLTAEKQEKKVWEIGLGIYDDRGNLEKIQGFICDVNLI